MPRTARASRGGYCYHVLNRGNSRSTVFHNDGDYAALVQLLQEADERIPIRLLAYCLMPNHFHLVVWPRHDGDLSHFMKWLMSTQVRRYLQHYQSGGHIWQGRFKAFPIKKDEHLLTVLRFVERNPLRAKLVQRAQDWRWSSLGQPRGEGPLLDAGPVQRSRRWREFVNRPQPKAEVERLRVSVERGRPFGEEPWMLKTARKLGLEASIRPRGRPRKEAKSAPLLSGG